MLEQHRIDIIVAKNSGGPATYGKIAAARALSLPVILLRRPLPPPYPPPQAGEGREGAAVETVDDAVAWLDHASTPAADFNNFCGPPTIVTADLRTRRLSSFLGVTSGFPYGMAVDSTTNRAVVPTICDGLAGIYDLGRKTGIAVNPKGSVNIYPAIDETRGLIVMDQVVPADFGLNNNAMSSAVVMDEHGNVLATVEQFFFFNTFLTIGANNLQLNPATRSAYTLGPGQQQLEPFTY